MQKVAWYNGTPHTLTVLEQDPQGKIQGYLERGGPVLTFSMKKEIPESGPPVRLLSHHRFTPQESVVDDVVMRAYQPFTGENIDLDLLPGKTHSSDYDPDDLTSVQLVVSMPTAQFLLQRAIMGGNLTQRYTPTFISCPDTGPGSKVMGEHGEVLGVLYFCSFGPYYYPKLTFC